MRICGAANRWAGPSVRLNRRIHADASGQRRQVAMGRLPAKHVPREQPNARIEPLPSTGLSVKQLQITLPNSAGPPRLVAVRREVVSDRSASEVGHGHLKRPGWPERSGVTNVSRPALGPRRRHSRFRGVGRIRWSERSIPTRRASGGERRRAAVTKASVGQRDAPDYRGLSYRRRHIFHARYELVRRDAPHFFSADGLRSWLRSVRCGWSLGPRAGPAAVAGGAPAAPCGRGLTADLLQTMAMALALLDPACPQRTFERL